MYTNCIIINIIDKQNILNNTTNKFLHSSRSSWRTLFFSESSLILLTLSTCVETAVLTLHDKTLNRVNISLKNAILVTVTVKVTLTSKNY